MNIEKLIQKLSSRLIFDKKLLRKVGLGWFWLVDACNFCCFYFFKNVDFVDFVDRIEARIPFLYCVKLLIFKVKFNFYSGNKTVTIKSMEVILFLLFFTALLFLFIALLERPFINKIQKQVKESYGVLPLNTSLNEIAPEIGYVFPDAIPLTTTTIRLGRGSQRMTVHVPNCPDCGKYLKAIDGKYGKFWGCTGYPNCHYTRSYS